MQNIGKRRFSIFSRMEVKKESKPRLFQPVEFHTL